ncbi:hypothetical protein P171DRAFT_432383 [Karstenula rhodostoma CBS 690.94]|uniref:N-acetyltransferase domain-containing protein n=1 Tax=Karstenula rhodostoma CBS 690.94 TaxID=1392251 RepID=A0A9P4PFX1_9PLEO|nr:hypothetical protein P171DRAFT_432383 [Karstenula rhodostoma CBS 690.94]
MPATLEDPSAPVILRTSGSAPYPPPGGPLPVGVAPRQVTLRDRVTTATVIPFSAPNQVPITLLAYLCDQLGREIEKGDTYPIVDPLPLENFGPYWFGVFGAIVLLGDVHDGRQIHEMARNGCDWEKECLGSFYIKPNYPGRSSHVCNGGFLVTDASRNRGVGRLMGEIYLDWAPKMGYTYSVFNLVYETNVASCRIWDALGFKRLGRVKGCGNLKSYPGELVDAIIYGRDLGQDDDFVSEERFDKIRFYLKNGKYPHGADRAEKSRLRSAATHYKLYPASSSGAERLMLKGKEVISDPQRQYEIARDVHHRAHGGINKTTATIAESFHWVRIKETVSQVIRNCPECSEMNKGLAIERLRTGQPTRWGTQLHHESSLDSQTTSPHPQQHQQHQHFVSPPPAHPLERPTSPSTQLQLEAAAQHPDFYDFAAQHHASFDLPVDPALMNGVAPPLGLENLPPSPFLNAAQNLTHSSMANIPNMDLPATDASQMNAQAIEDVTMDGTADRAPTAREELRRRLTRAGYAKQSSV